MRLCLIWATAALVLFSLTSGKQVHYLIPEFPAVALLVARAQAETRPSGALVPALLVALLALVALVAATGAVPLGDAAALLQPRMALVGWALLAAALAWGGYRLGGAAGITLLGLGLVLAIDLLFGVTKARQIYGGDEIVRSLAEGDEAEGIAVAGWGYNAEFNFPARLERPVAELDDADADERLGRRAPRRPDRRAGGSEGAADGRRGLRRITLGGTTGCGSWPTGRRRSAGQAAATSCAASQAATLARACSATRATGHPAWNSEEPRPKPSAPAAHQVAKSFGPTPPTA